MPLGDWNLESGGRERERHVSFGFIVCVCGEDFGAASDRVC